MLKKHSQFFESLLLISDLVIIALSWVLSYHIRFYGHVVPTDRGVPDFSMYAVLLLPILVIWFFAFKSFGLYRPKRIGTHLSEVFDITKACVVSVLILIAITFFFKRDEFSRLVFIFFVAINIVSLSFERLVFREALRYLRRKGHNLRHAIVAGAGENAESLIRRLEGHPEVGIRIEGVIGVDPARSEGKVAGVKVIGQCDRIGEVIRERSIDIVFIALSWEEHSMFASVLKSIGDETVDIKVIPDIFEFMTLRGGVEEFDGLPILNIQNSPLYGWNTIVKRSVDVIVSVAAIALLFPFLLLIAAVVKLTSPGPVLYRQERMGIGGDTFEMLKFRSMRTDAEKESGAVWACKDDPRRTVVGAFLRRTSLDELPQLFNVLRGDMSIVGPRPERPVFIQGFRKDIPKYMLRHTMKAGITGWAQVNGWRGDTDINKRIEHDLYYIEHWSLMLDIKILLMTIWKGLINRNAY